MSPTPVLNFSCPPLTSVPEVPRHLPVIPLINQLPAHGRQQRRQVHLRPASPLLLAEVVDQVVPLADVQQVQRAVLHQLRARDHVTARLQRRQTGLGARRQLAVV